MLGKFSIDDILKYFCLFFPRKYASTFRANNNLHDMSTPIFGENKKIIVKFSTAELAQRVAHASNTFL